MEQELTLVRIGHSARLERLLPQALAGLRVKELPPERIEQAAGCRLLFAAALDEYGPDETVCRLLRTLRKHPDCLSGSYGGVIVDGAGELYTKQTARELVLAANQAGCAFPGSFSFPIQMSVMEKIKTSANPKSLSAADRLLDEKLSLLRRAAGRSDGRA